MAQTIPWEDNARIAYFYAESLIKYYVNEYSMWGQPADENSTEDPNDKDPASF
jgi:hypothetical protein